MSQSKGFAHAVPWLSSLFNCYPENGLNECTLWAVGLSIYTINNKVFYPEVVRICSKRKFGRGRQMLMGSLARAKTDEAYQVLLKAIHDPSVRAHAIEALGRFGRIDAIPIIEKLSVEKGLYEHKAKETSLRRLKRKLCK